MTSNPQDLLELYQISRQVQWRYQLDKVEVQHLEKALRTIERAIPQSLYGADGLRTAYERRRNLDIQRELRNLFAGIREQMTGEISAMAGNAGAESVAFHTRTMTVGGLVPVNNVALSAEQFRSFFQTTPLGGHKLKEWVNRAFNHSVIDKLKMDLDAGVLRGKGYRGLVNNIMKHMEGFTRKEAINVARSYVQSANCLAQQAVMMANDDIVKGWRWSSVMEQGNFETGRGTCLACAANDGLEYPTGEGPPIPKHINCRCFPVSITKTYRELGIDADELEEVARPWTEREDLPIGEGGRNIEDYGKHKGNYDSWFESRGERFQRNVLGPRRYELWEKGKVDFKDFVNPKTGKLYLISELTN